MLSLDYLISAPEPQYRIDIFSFVDEAGALFEDVELDDRRIAESYGCNFGSAILEMTKLQ